ncbi:hypothetical protein [Azospirillum doebereinerae]|uniref:Uncharacterized protein n=1 Tax=Azospirillum doebereinerae TaxID=92933 RepID=A0A433J225_9PROT|nr:hypothetical protein [Azospirillum doebereinerae]MCG5242305.1 hypothetical protein [Azospirillum doebereinerae]RUQ65142.1 hypothetical protein EJ913_25690 [Azospirillum doebereinerae]
MKTIACALLALSFASSAALADTSTGTIKTGPYKPICSSNPKACGAGYDPLKRPHIPTVPTAPPPR